MPELILESRCHRVKKAFISSIDMSIMSKREHKSTRIRSLETELGCLDWLQHDSTAHKHVGIS